jgi:hypothetical protein
MTTIIRNFPLGHPAMNTPVICHPETQPRPFSRQRFRRQCILSAPVQTHIWISASQRFILTINHDLIARGPSRSDPQRWNVTRVPLDLKAGPQQIDVTVVHFGPHAGKGQLGGELFFLLASEDPGLHECIHTGDAWLTTLDLSRSPQLRRPGIKTRGHQALGMAERFDAGKQEEQWVTPRILVPAIENRWGNLSIQHNLRPDPLPPLPIEQPLDLVCREPENATFPLQLPAQTKTRIILDAGTLTNAYPEIIWCEGRSSQIHIIYAESPLDPSTKKKGNRDQIIGKVFSGQMDIILPDGQPHQSFTPSWFRAFRYLVLDVETTSHPITLQAIQYRPTGYPLSSKAEILPEATDDIPWQALLEITHRTACLCSHETLFDCPQYEQAQFPGDARILARYHYRICDQDSLIRKAIDDLHASRQPCGLLLSHWPSTFLQILPTYSLQWVCMLGEFLKERRDPDFVQPYLPAAREILSWFASQRRQDGLVSRMPWAPFIDWCDGFDAGRAPEDPDGGSAIITGLLSQACTWLSDLETGAGFPETGPRWQQLSGHLNQSLRETCFDSDTGIFSDTPSRNSYSVHAQVEATLAGALTPVEARRALTATWKQPGVIQTGTFYYQAFVQDAFRLCGWQHRYSELLAPFLSLLDQTGLTTWPERMDTESRSDCHGWSILPALLAIEMSDSSLT